MKINWKDPKTLTLNAGIAVAVFVIISLALAYLTPFRDPITVSFKRLYPASFIGSRVVSVNDLEQAEIIGQSFGLTKAEARQKQIDNEKAFEVAKNIDLKIKSDAAANEKRFYTKGNEMEYKNLLNLKFNRSERIFYKYVITPQVVDAYLKMHYFSSVKNSSVAYARAKAVLERLDKGEKFEDLARMESDDKLSGQLGGDLGFYESGQIIPELEDQSSISTMGEVRKDVIITRLGYHVIYPIEYSSIEGKKMWHLKHILFTEDGFDKWLETQTKSIKVKNIGQ
jgi:parvulin-like peptidyl-prolyl isomerase